jgi:hypothetical protein
MFEITLFNETNNRYTTRETINAEKFYFCDNGFISFYNENYRDTERPSFGKEISTVCSYNSKNVIKIEYKPNI